MLTIVTIYTINMYLNPRNIHKLYESCQWQPDNLDHMHRKVKILTETVHHLHERRCMLVRNKLGTMLLRDMPDSLMRTKGCKGAPWQSFLRGRDGLPIGDPNDIDKLLAAASVTGLITIETRHVEGVITPVTYAVIEDGFIQYNLRRKASQRSAKYRLHKSIHPH